MSRTTTVGIEFIASLSKARSDYDKFIADVESRRVNVNFGTGEAGGETGGRPATFGTSGTGSRAAASSSALDRLRDQLDRDIASRIGGIAGLRSTMESQFVDALKENRKADALRLASGINRVESRQDTEQFRAFVAEGRAQERVVAAEQRRAAALERLAQRDEARLARQTEREERVADVGLRRLGAQEARAGEQIATEAGRLSQAQLRYRLAAAPVGQRAAILREAAGQETEGSAEQYNLLAQAEAAEQRGGIRGQLARLRLPFAAFFAYHQVSNLFRQFQVGEQSNYALQRGDTDAALQQSESILAARTTEGLPSAIRAGLSYIPGIGRYYDDAVNLERVRTAQRARAAEQQSDKLRDETRNLGRQQALLGMGEYDRQIAQARFGYEDASRQVASIRHTAANLAPFSAQAAAELNTRADQYQAAAGALSGAQQYQAILNRTSDRAGLRIAGETARLALTEGPGAASLYRLRETNQNEEAAEQDADRRRRLADRNRRVEDLAQYEVNAQAYIRQQTIEGATRANYLGAQNRPFEKGLSQLLTQNAVALAVVQEPADRSRVMFENLSRVVEYSAEFARRISGINRQNFGAADIGRMLLGGDERGAAIARVRQQRDEELANAPGGLAGYLIRGGIRARYAVAEQLTARDVDTSIFSRQQGLRDTLKETTLDAQGKNLSSNAQAIYDAANRQAEIYRRQSLGTEADLTEQIGRQSLLAYRRQLVRGSGAAAAFEPGTLGQGYDLSKVATSSESPQSAIAFIDDLLKKGFGGGGVGGPGGAGPTITKEQGEDLKTLLQRLIDVFQ